MGVQRDAHGRRLILSCHQPIECGCKLMYNECECEYLVSRAAHCCCTLFAGSADARRPRLPRLSNHPHQRRAFGDSATCIVLQGMYVCSICRSCVRNITHPRASQASAPADAAPGLFLVFAENVAGTEPLSRILSRSSYTWVRPKTSVNGLRRVCR